MWLMASVTYGNCYLWQKYYGKCNYGKNIMANETEPWGHWHQKLHYHGLQFEPRFQTLELDQKYPIRS